MLEALAKNAISGVCNNPRPFGLSRVLLARFLI